MLRKANVINCHELGIRKDPADMQNLEVISSTAKAGDELTVDVSEVIYSWNDAKFYRVVSLEKTVGYALIDCLEIKE